MMTEGVQTHLWDIESSQDNFKFEQETSETQNKNILELFRKHAGFSFSPWRIRKLYEAYYHRPILISSIRRALTTFTIKGKLIKTHEMVNEEMGKPNHTWKYNNTEK